MNRRQFMKELGTGLVETFREAAAPFVEKDLRKLSGLADAWSGLDFHPVPADLWESGGAEGQARMITVGGEPVLAGWTGGSGGGGRSAYSGKCPGCGGLLHFLAYAGRAKCFACDGEYGLEPDTALTRLVIRSIGGRTCIGLPAKGREAPHA